MVDGFGLERGSDSSSSKDYSDDVDVGLFDLSSEDPSYRREGKGKDDMIRLIGKRSVIRILSSVIFQIQIHIYAVDETYRYVHISSSNSNIILNLSTCTWTYKSTRSLPFLSVPIAQGSIFQYFKSLACWMNCGS